MADTKITAMTAATALARADLVAVVQDVATTPVNRSATLDVLDPGQTLGGDASGASTNVAVGSGADTQLGVRHVAIGEGAKTGNATFTSRSEGIAIGYLANAQGSGDGVIAIGSGADATSTTSIAIGMDSLCSGTLGLAVGLEASCSGARSLAVGYQAQATQSDATAVGPGSSADHGDSIAIGHDSATSATFQVMVGPRDIEITGVVKGLVLEDRTLNTRHRVYLDNGTLSIEAA